MSNVTLRPYDTANYLRDDEDIAAYWEAALELGMAESDPGFIAHSLGAIARAKHAMGALADATGLPEERLRTALSSDGQMELATLVTVIKALGLRLHGGGAQPSQ